jgi:hypothetical protein
VLSALTAALGQGAWKKSLVLLTHANAGARALRVLVCVCVCVCVCARACVRVCPDRVLGGMEGRGGAAALHAASCVVSAPFTLPHTVTHGHTPVPRAATHTWQRATSWARST